jgi:hypothetical protein
MNLFNGIKSKVWFCAGIGLLGFLVATVSTYQSNSRLVDDLVTLRDVEFPLSLQGEEVLNLFVKQTSFYEDAFLLADEDALAEGDALAEPIQSLFSVMLQKLAADESRFLPIRKQITSLQKSYGEYASMSSLNYALLVNGAEVAALQGKIRILGTMQQEIASNLTQLNDTLKKGVEKLSSEASLC